MPPIAYLLSARAASIPKLDHRIVEGAQTAAFIGELRGLIESPDVTPVGL